MNKLSNIVNRYDDLLYESRPSSFNEFINNKYNDVHNQLYQDALNKFITEFVGKYIDSEFIYSFYSIFKDIYDDVNYVNKTNVEKFDVIYNKSINTDIINNNLTILGVNFKITLRTLYDITLNYININGNLSYDDSLIFKTAYNNVVYNLYKKYHKIVEIKNSEYWMPSSIFIINKIAPFNKNVIDLSNYWNMNQSNNNSELSDLKITNENIDDSEITEINYVSGKAKLYSRATDIEYEVPFKYLNENTNVSDEMILSNSFITKYNAL